MKLLCHRDAHRERMRLNGRLEGGITRLYLKDFLFLVLDHFVNLCLILLG